tara:strand:+ start:320 stop:970 length:651 start_codon:yes stop_codon:yes gene_type:complete
MKREIIVPNKLKDISLKQYQKFLRIQDKNDDQYFLQCKMIEIFCNLDALAVRKMKLDDADKVSKIINDVFKKKPKLIRHFTLNGIEYGFLPNLENMSFGEYIDLDTYISDWQNMHIAMNVLYRPIKEKIEDKYLIKEYDTEAKENMIDMPLDVVLGAINFFFHLGMDLSSNMMNYLENNQNKDLTEYLSSLENGDGINHFMHSLREILQSSKISLN